MRPKSWTRSSLLRLSGLALALVAAFGPTRAHACAGGDTNIEAETFFDPAVLGRAELAPLAFDPYQRLHNVATGTADFTELNLRDWDAFFGGKLARAPWSKLLYKAPLPELDRLIFRLKGKAGTTGGPDDAAFLAYANRKSLIEALYYVGFAKRVEPFALGHDDWQPPTRPDAITLRKLLEAGTAAFDKESDPFLRKRYALQLARLRFFGGDDAGTVAFVDAHPDVLGGDDGPSWRAQAYAAGALRHLKRWAEANARYARVYDHSPALAVTAAWSFHPQAEKDWAEALALAKSPREKAVLWQLLGLYADDGLRAMKEIHALDPKSDLLPLLVVREVNRIESSSREGSARDAKALLAFLDEGASRDDVSQPYLWALADAHLHAATGDVSAAQRLVDRAAKLAPQVDAVQAQLRVTRFYARMQGLKRVSPADEPVLAGELGWLAQRVGAGAAANVKQERARAFLAWAHQRLGQVFAAQGDPVRASLANPAVGAYFDPKFLDALDATLNKAKKSPLEAVLAASYPHNADALARTRALALFYTGDYEGAAALFAKKKQEPSSQFNPFVQQIRDCYECDNHPPQAPFSDESFARSMVDAARLAKGTDAAAVDANLRLGTALYNVSHYGSWRGFCFDATDVACNNPARNDLRRAAAYFHAAAERTKDRELAARATYYAAKCELVAFYEDPAHKGDFTVGPSFHALREHYADTKYFKEVLHECSYFRNFMAE